MIGQDMVNEPEERSKGADLRDSGLGIVGRLPWGAHFCQFYENGEDLLDLLVPFFKAGLEGNELCVWVTADPVGVAEATQAMRKAVPDLDRYLAAEQLVILPHSEWHLKGGAFELEGVLSARVDKLDAALTRGYDGIRITGNTAWLETKGWDRLNDYEEAVDGATGRYRMMALCSYPVDLCGVSEVADVFRNHEFAIVKRKGRWEIIQSRGRKRTEAECVRLLGELQVQNERIQAQNEELQAQNEELGAQRQALLETQVEIERVNARLEALNAVAGAVNRSLDLGEVLGAGLEKALEVGGLEGGGIYLLDEDSGLLRIRVHRGLPDGFVDIIRTIPPGEGFTGRAFQLGQPAVFDFVKDAARVIPGVSGFGIVAVASIPVRLGNEVVGVMNLASQKPHEFSQREIALFCSIGDVMATAVENARLYQKARDQELHSRTIITASGDGIFVVDGSQRVSEVNPALHALAGYKAEDVLGKHCRYLINARNPDGSSLCDTTCPFLNPQQEHWEPLEAQITTRDGRDIWVEVTYGSVRDGTGRLVGVVHNIRDVTARKEFDRLKDEFLSVAAHELKTPLTSLKGYAQATLRRIQDVDDREAEIRALKVIVSQTDRMADLVNDLLEVSRIQSGQLELRRDRLDLGGPAQEVIEHLQITTDRHRLDLAVDGVVRVIGDYARIEQVFFNLIHNAIKYSPDGGDVVIRVKAQDGLATVSVKDSGVGIPREKQTLLFDRFYRAHAGNASFGGLGLGLHISREIVRNLGGEMWVDSEGGNGSTFYFTLPLA